MLVTWKVSNASEICITKYEVTVRKISSGNMDNDPHVISIQRQLTIALVELEKGNDYELEIKAFANGFNPLRKLNITF